VKRRATAALVGCALLAACGGPAPKGAVRSGAELRTDPIGPTDLLPNDLDFVVRIDSRRLREDTALKTAARDLGQASTGVLRSVWPTLEGSQAVYVGGRLMSDGFHGDGVIAIEQSAPTEDPRPLDPSFRRLVDAPAGVELFDRPAAARDEAALEIILEGRGMVLATPSEVDAVLRVLRSQPDRDRLDPPARGLASFAGKVRGDRVLQGSDGPLSRASEGLDRYSGSLESGDALRIEADLVYRSRERSDQAARTLAAILAHLASAEEPLRSLSDSVKLANDGPRLALQATVPFAVIARLH